LILNWKKFFSDIETWHIWGIIATQKSFKSDNANLDREKFMKETFQESTNGINAMSISELTGIQSYVFTIELTRFLSISVT